MNPLAPQERARSCRQHLSGSLRENDVARAYGAKVKFQAMLAVAILVGAYSGAFGQATALRVLEKTEKMSNGMNGGQTPAQPAPAHPPKPDPTLTATLENIAALQTNLAALQSDPTKKQPLINNLDAAPHGSQPAHGAVSKLSDDLAVALSGKHIPDDQLKKLGAIIHAVFNGSHLSSAQVDSVAVDARKILSDGGVAQDQADTVVADLKTIAAQTK